MIVSAASLLWIGIFFSVHPGCNRFPFGVVSRSPELSAGVGPVASRVDGERMKQQTAGSRIARRDQRRHNLEVLARLFESPCAGALVERLKAHTRRDSGVATCAGV